MALSSLQQSRNASAIRVGDYKLLEYFENGSVQLFNLKTDIGETTNLAASNPDLVSDLRAKLHGWRAEISAQMPEKNEKFDSKAYPWSAEK